MTLDKPITKTGIYGALQEQLKKVNNARRDLKAAQDKYADFHPMVRDTRLIVGAEEHKALRLMFRYVGMREEES